MGIHLNHPTEEQRLQTQRANNGATPPQPIAIIGIGCRFPGGANDPASYWKMLDDGVDAIGETPADRWSLKKFFMADGAKPGKTQSKWGGYVDSIDLFDPQLFGISPREAASMDPQQRMLLEVAWRAMEDGGHPVERLAGKQVAVFVGISSIDYSVAGLSYQDRGFIHPYSNTGGSSSIAANRISYCFDFRGPSVAVDTACSSSLVAVHMACESLWKGESECALAGGVNALLLPDFYVAFSQLGVLSPDGRCKAFDSRANGYVRSEGAGMILLKPLRQALEAGDSIYAVIRATGLNQDGRTPGLTVPSQEAQEELLRTTCRRAGIHPKEVQYVEAHGTGTSVGDPIEANALGAVLGENRSSQLPCWIGSVKTNIGHLEAGAGMASIIKVALALKHQRIPKHLHFLEPNPSIDFERLKLRIPTTSQPWPVNGRVRIAGVNGFGYGGANGHVLLSDIPSEFARIESIPNKENHSSESSTEERLLPFSARSASALRSTASTLIEWLEKQGSLHSLYAIGAHLAWKRSHLEYRAILLGSHRDAMIDQLRKIVASTNDQELQPLPVHQRDKGIVFVCSGQGPQWWAMGRPLLDQSPIFRETIEACDREFRKYGTWSLLTELMRDEASSRMQQTSIAQPCLFALQVALAEHWRRLGIRPTAVVGHSVGEIAAAWIAGALTFEDACCVAFHRGRTMDLATSRGGMLAVGLTVDEAKQWVDFDREDLSIAAMNGPSSLTISGDREAIDSLEKRLSSAGIFARKLAVEYAFHSAHMDPVQGELLRALATIRPRATELQLVSTVTGRTIDGSQLDADYWWRNVRQGVRFADAMRAMAESGWNTLLELGPHPVLAFAITECFQAARESVRVFPSLRREQNDLSCTLRSLGSLYQLGFEVDWEALYAKPQGVLGLPTYPFQKQRCWSESPESRWTRQPDFFHPLLGESAHRPIPEWNGRLDLRVQNYLADHRVRGVCLLPAAALVENGLTVARQLRPEGPLQLERLRLHNACILSQDRPQWLHASYRPDRRQLEFSFRECEEDKWTPLATIGIGSGSPLEVDKRTLDKKLSEASIRCNESFDRQRFYEYCRQIGLDYGAPFRGLMEGQRRDGEAIVMVDLPSELADASESYVIHPALLDACFHAMIATDPDFFMKPTMLFLPWEIRQVTCWKQPGRQLRVHAVLHLKDNRHMLADIAIYDDQGDLCISLDGFLSQRVASGRAEEGMREMTYNYAWVEADSDATKPETRVPSQDSAPQASVPTPRRWLLFVDGDGLGDAVAAGLRKQGDHVVTVQPSNRFGTNGADAWIIDPQRPSDFDKLFTSLREPVTHLLYFWGLETPSNEQLTSDLLDGSSLFTSVAPLYLIQAWDRASEKGQARLAIVTCNAQTLAEPSPVAVAQGPLLGFGRVIVSEYARLQTKLIDIDHVESPEAIQALLDEVRLEDEEDEILLRSGKRFLHRFQQQMDHPLPQDAVKALPFGLRLGKGSGIAELHYSTEQKKPLEANQVEIQVGAVGLNFSDVMKALDMYPGLVGKPVELGAECSGVISRVGSGIKDWKVGDEVIAVAPGAFASHVVVDASLVARKPKGLTHEQAACIPIPFLTASYALEDCARLAKGDSLLIHSATGGVGMAAMQIAKHHGWLPFVSAGSVEKRRFLENPSLYSDAVPKTDLSSRILDSRSLDFADQILSRTEGKGVDAVLNSLPGEAIPKGLSCLAIGGRFLEIGKRDIYGDAPLGLYPLRNNLSFFAIDLDQLFKTQPKRMGRLLRETVDRFDRGELKPLPTTSFRCEETNQAFRLMQQGKHLGKVAVTMSSPGWRCFQGSTSR